MEFCHAIRSTVLILMYFVLPIWLLVGFADWLCHRATHIETTTGAKESLIHLLMFGEVGVPLLAALFLNVNALIIAIMIAAFFLHEATALWDVSYATTARTVTPVEQHVHSFLEMIPLLAVVSVISLHWDNFSRCSAPAPSPLTSISAGNPSLCRSHTSSLSWLPFCCWNCFPTSKNFSADCARMTAD